MEQNINTNQELIKDSHKSSKWVRGSVIVAIVIVMNLFFNYAVSLVYQEPSYDQFIKQPQVIEEINTKESCLAVGGQWNANVYPTDKTTPTKITGYCDSNFTNQKNYDEAVKIYDRNVFITLVLLGVIVLILGSFVSISILSLAFSWGGVLSLVIASMRYWSSADKIIRVVILGIALITLIWLAVKKFSK